MGKVNFNQVQSDIEVFYDGHCAMCRTFIAWLEKQEHLLDVACHDYHDQQTLLVFPNIGEYDPTKEIVVRVDGEQVCTGAEGWVCCLWGCKKYRGVARKVNNKVLLPMAKKVCYLISNNRLALSKLLFRKKNKKIADEIEQQKVIENQEIECAGGCE